MQFRLGSIPVRIHGSFLLTALFLGAADPNPARLAVWVVVMFVSVLVHELGHAAVGKIFGLTPQIDLHGMGGTTTWTQGRNIGNWRSIVISLAGPFAGFFLAGIIAAARTFGLDPQHPVGKDAVQQLLLINIVWGIFNLLPMLPLDGGNVLRSFLDAVTRGRGEKPARYVSIAVNVVVGLLGLWSKNWFIVLLAVLFAVRNVQALRQVDRVRTDTVLADAIQRAHPALQRENGREALAILRPALDPQILGRATPELHAMAVRTYAYALLIEGEWRELMLVLDRDRERIGGDDLARFAHTARELGRPDEALQIEALAAPGPAPALLTDFKA